jgi:hypothetical protein
MRPITLSAWLLAAIVAAQHDGMSMSMAGMSKPAPETVSSAKKAPAPDGCKKLSTDADWPSKEVWDAELPGWENSMADPGMKHPDVVYEVKTKGSVAKAVKFVAKHNVRLSILNSGHDFLAR